MECSAKNDIRVAPLFEKTVDMVMKELEMSNSIHGSMYSHSSQHSGDSRRSNNSSSSIGVGTGIDGLGGARGNMLFGGEAKPFTRKSIKI